MGEWILIIFFIGFVAYFISLRSHRALKGRGVKYAGVASGLIFVVSFLAIAAGLVVVIALNFRR